MAALCGLVLTAATAEAQEIGAAEVSGGYAFLGSSEIVDGHTAGWLVGSAWNLAPWLAAAVELNRHSQEQDVGLLLLDARVLSLQAGPRVTMPLGRLRPFAQLLLGRTAVDLELQTVLPPGASGRFDEDRFSWQLGGGVDVAMDRQFWIRIAFDYRRIATTERLSQYRVSTALVYTFR